MSESVVVLEGLALFRERTRALEATGGSGSESDSLSGISTSMTDSGEGSLGESLAGLASGWELQAMAEAVALAVVVAVVVAVVGTVYVGLGPVALTWNLDGLQA